MKGAVLGRKMFYANKQASDIIHRGPSFSSRPGASKHMDASLESSGKQMTSGECHVLTQERHFAYQSVRRDKINTMRLCQFYLPFSIANY